MRDGSLGNYLVRAAHVGDAGLRDRIGCRRGAAASDVPASALAKPDPRLSKEHQAWLRGSRDSGTRARQSRAVCAPAWNGMDRRFAHECKAALPCPSAATVADLLIRFLVAEHTGVLIVKTDFAELSRFPNLPIRKRPARELAFNVTPNDSEFRVCLLATWHLYAGELEEQASEITHATHRRRPSFGRTRRTQSRPHQATNRSDEAETQV